MYIFIFFNKKITISDLRGGKTSGEGVYRSIIKTAYFAYLTQL